MTCGMAVPEVDSLEVILDEGKRKPFFSPLPQFFFHKGEKRSVALLGTSRKQQ